VGEPVGIALDDMRILQLISSAGFFGAENVMLELAAGLRERHLECVVGVIKNLYNPHVEIADEAERKGLRVIVFPCRRKLDLRAVRSLRRFLREEAIGVIHGHGYKSNVYAHLAAAGEDIGRITTCHNWLGDDAKMKLYAWLDGRMLRRFDRVIGVSESVVEEILRQGVEPGKVLRIDNGIDVERYRDGGGKGGEGLRRALGIDPNWKVIGTVGRLSEEKGHRCFLEAAERVLESHGRLVFLIVGDGPLRRSLEERASRMGREGSGKEGSGDARFIFTGIRSDMPAVYSVMDMFVLPSLTEGLPMALLEAIASGRPAVATRVGAVPTLIQDGYSGLLVEAGEAGELAEAMMKLLRNPEKAREFAEHAQRGIEERFSSQTMVDRYIGVYESVLMRRRGRG
jgi:glycosyltransferase involved in cell wall biosynthesis